MTDFLPLPPPGPKTTTQVREITAMAAARKLEASFLAEMLKSTGLGEQKNSFSGNAGEDQFASFHRQAIADRMVESGGIGLAEMFCKSMMERIDD